jgi:ABC-type dipeptide/oligopeptide/nickel transport system permease component
MLQDVLRNAMIPLLTVLSFSIGNLVGGVVVIEQVFNWPGVGQYALSAFQANDYNPIEAYVLLCVFAFVTVNLVTDILYGVIDPRIRYG